MKGNDSGQGTAGTLCRNRLVIHSIEGMTLNTGIQECLEAQRLALQGHDRIV